MKNNCIKENIEKVVAVFILSVIAMCSFYITAFAMTKEDIAAHDDRVTIDRGMLSFHAKDKNDIWEQYYSIISDNLRTHTGYEETWLSWEPDGNGYTCWIDNGYLDNFLNEKDWVEEWCKTNVKNWVLNGASKDVAIRCVLMYCNGFNYDYNMAKNQTGSMKKEFTLSASSFSMIQKQNGVCVGFSSAFRSLLESVPFDPETGLVNWDSDNPIYMKVAILRNKTHMWNAVQNDDGTWTWYDATLGSSVSKETVNSMSDYLNSGEIIWSY